MGGVGVKIINLPKTKYVVCKQLRYLLGCGLVEKTWPGARERGYKVTPVYTCTLLHSLAGQIITKKLKSSKKVCELIAPVVHSVYSSGVCACSIEYLSQV